MRVAIHQLVLPLDYEPKDVAAAAARRLRRPAGDLRGLTVARRSIDARKRRRAPVFVLSVEADLDGPPPAGAAGRVEVLPDAPAALPVLPRLLAPPPAGRVVVVGAGPAGLMAALALAEAGCQPLLIERGAPVERRTRQVGEFWSAGRLDAESNVLFGEGGAGLFSDGKLTSRSKDRPRVRRFLAAMVEAGAPADILVDAEPHLGSDVLARLVPALRGMILHAGGEVRFGCRLEAVEIEGRTLRAVRAGGETIAASACVLATGHSARDVYRMLHSAGVPLAAKAFAVGLRAELPQRRIDRARWGAGAGHPRLGAASLRFTRPASGGARACYSFCMCPGGVVIACASEPGMLTTNGMSLAARDGPLGNAAFLVPVGPEDYQAAGEGRIDRRDAEVAGGNGSPAGDGLPAELGGLEFQAAIERRAFQAGGGDYSLPACRLTEFLAAAEPRDLPAEPSCRRARPANLRDVLPECVTRTLVEAAPDLLGKQKGVVLEEVTLYAAETRSSSPVRIVRDEAGQSVGAAGLFPAGEGAGYAGGIVSSAVDGLRAAEEVMHALQKR